MFIYSRAWQRVAFTSGFCFVQGRVALSEKPVFFLCFFVKMLSPGAFSPPLPELFFKTLLSKRYFFCSFPLRIKVKHNQRNFSLALTKVTSKFFVPSFCFTSDHEESPGTISWNNASPRRRSWSAGFCHRTNLFCSVLDRILT